MTKSGQRVVCACLLFFALHDFAQARPFVPRFELCGYACFASLRIFFLGLCILKNACISCCVFG